MILYKQFWFITFAAQTHSMKKLLILLLMPLTVKAQNDSLNYRMKKAGRELQRFSNGAAAGIALQAGGLFFAGLGASYTANQTTSPSRTGTSNNGNILIYTGIGISLIGTLIFITSYTHAGRAGYYLSGQGLTIPLDNNKRKKAK
ncbi:MAG: hypothetical protein BGO70_18415 [Bacteroidetes bacterium 43-93]|nr:MAG: hypothetical protein BGO70_18415 [Bacteroidetes bacterium 43-93]